MADGIGSWRFVKMGCSVGHQVPLSLERSGARHKANWANDVFHIQKPQLHKEHYKFFKRKGYNEL